MLSPEHITQTTRRLAARAGHPAKVILFGSYARGDADDGSDLDLILVSAQEFERRSQVPGTAAYWAKKEGKILYDAAA